MMVVDKLDPGKPFALVLTGDGPDERRVLVGLAPSFDDDKQLFFPPPQGRTGFTALNALREYAKPELMRLGRLAVLFLIDKEHFRTDDLAGELEAQLKARGMRIVEMDELSSAAFYIKAMLGQKELNIYVTVLGHERRIEENIAELLREMGYPTKPDKRCIRDKLRKVGTRRLEDFIRRACEGSMSAVEKAFSSLIRALRELDKALQADISASRSSRRTSSTSASSDLS